MSIRLRNCRENTAKIRKKYKFSVILVDILKKKLQEYAEKLSGNFDNLEKI